MKHIWVTKEEYAAIEHMQPHSLTAFLQLFAPVRAKELSDILTVREEIVVNIPQKENVDKKSSLKFTFRS